jgi:hypothetical protein
MLESRPDDPSGLKTLKHEIIKQNTSFFRAHGLDLLSHGLFWSLHIVVLGLDVSCDKLAALSGRSCILFVWFVGADTTNMSQLFAGEASPLLLELYLLLCC